MNATCNTLPVALDAHLVSQAALSTLLPSHPTTACPPSRDTYMLRSPDITKPRASLPVPGTSTTNRSTILSARPRSANPSANYVQSRLPAPPSTAPQNPALLNSRRRSSTLVDDRTTRMKPLSSEAPTPRRRKSSDAAINDVPLSAQYKRRGLIRASDTPTLSRTRSRTSPPRSVYVAESYPTPPPSVGPSLTRRTTYRAARTPTLAVRDLPTAQAPVSQSRVLHTTNLPSATHPLKIRRRTQTSSNRAVRWRPRSPNPGVLLLLDEIANFQAEWTQLFSDPAFERAWNVFLDAHPDEYEKNIQPPSENQARPARTVQPRRRESLPATRRTVSLRPTLGDETDEDKMMRRKSPVADIFSMLSRDARPIGRSVRISSPPRMPLPDVPNVSARVRMSKDSIVSTSSNIRSSVATSISSTRPDSTRTSYASTAPGSDGVSPTRPIQRLSSPSTTSPSLEAIASSDSGSSLYSVNSTFTEISSSPPVEKSLRRNAVLPACPPQQLPTPPEETSPNPLGLVGVPHGYFSGVPAEVAMYSANQAFALTDSPLALSPDSVELPMDFRPPIGGNVRVSATSGSRSRQTTASLANARTPGAFESPRRPPPTRSASLQVQPQMHVQNPVRSGSLRGIHKLFDRRASDSITGKDSKAESLKSRISGPSVTVVGIAVDGLDGMLDLRNLSVEEEDGSVYSGEE